MSLILEALRKSEAERRRGSAPDLARELPPTTAPVPTVRRTWWLAGGAGLALVLALLAWQWTPAPRVPTPLASDAAPGRDAPPAVRDPGTAPGAPGMPANGGASDPPPWPTVTRIAPVAAPPTDARRAAAAAAPTGTGIPEAGTGAGAAGDAAGDAPGQPPRPPDASIAGGRADGSDAAGEPVLPDAPDRPELRLSALSADARARLPPLKLTMHLWNDEPTARFVVLDGQRLGVGDRVGSGAIDAIDADGVVISLDGQRVRLPLR